MSVFCTRLATGGLSHMPRTVPQRLVLRAGRWSCLGRPGYTDGSAPMPELPDVTVYLEALRARILGARLIGLRLANPFVLRSVDPSPAEVAGRAVTGLRRVGKRIVIALEGDCFVVIHLMIAGRLHWKEAGARLPGKIGLAALDFSTGTLTLTEAGSKRRAAIHLVRGEAARRSPSWARAGCAGGARPRRDRAARRWPRCVPRGADQRVSHAQACVDRSAHPERRGQCLLRRDPAPGKAVAGADDARVDGAGDRPAPGRDEDHAPGLDRAAAARRGRRVPGGRDRLPSGHGGARPLRQALSGLRRAGAAHRARGERDQLLRALSDRRSAPGRPCPVPAPASGLAAHAGGDGGATAPLTSRESGLSEGRARA